MPLRRSHGKRRPEVPRHDELPDPVPANARTEQPEDRATGGRFARGNRVAREGGRAKAGTVKLAQSVGLSNLPTGSVLGPHKQAIKKFVTRECRRIASRWGGGDISEGVRSMVASAALARAWSLFFFDRASQTGDAADADRGLRYAEASRQHLLAARGAAAEEAQARPPPAPYAVYRTALAPTTTATPAAYAPRGDRDVDEDELTPPPSAKHAQKVTQAVPLEAADIGRTSIRVEEPACVPKVHPLFCTALVPYAGVFDVDALARVGPEHRAAVVAAEAKAAHVRGQIPRAAIEAAREQGWIAPTKGTDA